MSEKLILVKNGNMEELNTLLSEGYKMISINPVASHVSVSTGIQSGRTLSSIGDVYAYVQLMKVDAKIKTETDIDTESVFDRR